MDFSKNSLFVMIAIFASMAKTAKINILKFFFFQNKESHIGASNIEKWFQKSNHFVDYLKLPYLFLFFTFCVSKETYQGKIWRNLKKCVYPRSLFVTRPWDSYCWLVDGSLSPLYTSNGLFFNATKIFSRMAANPKSFEIPSKHVLRMVPILQNRNLRDNAVFFTLLLHNPTYQNFELLPS